MKGYVLSSRGVIQKQVVLCDKMSGGGEEGKGEEGKGEGKRRGGEGEGAPDWHMWHRWGKQRFDSFPSICG